MFQCTKCGLCCRNVQPLPNLDRGDGVCRYLDTKENLCTIYETRPTICNVAAMYEQFWRKFGLTEEEHHEAVKHACRVLQKEAGLPEEEWIR